MKKITKKIKAQILGEVVQKTRKNYETAVTASEQKQAEELISEIC